MRRFDFVRPQSISEAFGLLGEHGERARLLAGGTDLLVGIQVGKFRPDLLISLGRIQDLPAAITEDDGRLRIGAGVILTDLIAHPTVRRSFPALVEAASVVGSVQIRNRATLAGNVCNASPAADTVPALLVHRAEVELTGPTGARTVPLGRFLLGPGRTDRRPDEIVTAIELPIPGAPLGTSFQRLTRRRGVDLATVNLCCSVDGEGLIRFAFGAVGPTAVVAEDASGRLADPTIDPAQRRHALDDLASGISPISDVRAGADYRRAMVGVLSERALTTALTRLETP